jgi:hypothetical protein
MAVADNTIELPYSTVTNVASKWGLLINIDSATGDIARTTDWNLEDNENENYVKWWKM